MESKALTGPMGRQRALSVGWAETLCRGAGPTREEAKCGNPIYLVEEKNLLIFRCIRFVQFSYIVRFK